jgi:acetylornithine deacetylase
MSAIIYHETSCHDLEGVDVKDQIAELQYAVDIQRLLDLASALIQIPSENPPGNERPVAEFLASYLSDLGLPTELLDFAPGRTNVLSCLAGPRPGPHLIFNGHIDVVPAGDGWSLDPYKPEVRDGRLYGRGAADMKGGVAAMIAAVEAVRRVEIPLHGTLTLAFVADEEVGGSGTRQLVRNGLRGDWAIISEPTELRPVVAHKGDINFCVKVYGVAAHSSVPHRGVNAIYKAAKVVDLVQELSVRLSGRSHPLVGQATVSVGTIHGGTIAWMVPDQCDLSIDRRVLPSERPEEVIAEFRALLDDLSRQDDQFRFELSTPVLALPMEIDPDEAVVVALRAAVTRVLGSDPGVHGWSATCDASIFVHEAKIPTVIFGPGSIDYSAHKPDESVGVQELVQAAQVYALTIAHLLGHAC